jgi:hypothetical protein
MEEESRGGQGQETLKSYINISIVARLIHNTPPSYLLKIPFNIILSSVPESSNGSLPLTFPHQKPVRTSPLPRHIHQPSHSSSFVHSHTIW